MITYGKIFDQLDALAASTGEVLPADVIVRLAEDVANVFERYGVTVALSDHSEADRAADEDADAAAERLQD